MLFHQSDISAWGRCPAQFGYRRAGMPQSTSSAMAYGSVMHHAIQVFETALHEARIACNNKVRSPEYNQKFNEAIQVTLETFVHFWNPMNIEAICDPVPADGWLPRQGYSEMRKRGIDAIRKYADLIRYDDHELLGAEYSFNVPILGTWDDDLNEPHVLAGSIDRLAARHYKRNLTLCVDDYKTGKEYKYLRQNLQFTAYCYATTRPEFWTGWRGEDGFGEERGMKLYERFKDCARRGTWINMRRFEFQDAGFRAQTDYDRFALAVSQIAESIKHDIFPLTISGEACTYCDYRNVCGGVGVADDAHGQPS